MNTTELPQLNNGEGPEIYRLLKIGQYSVMPENDGFDLQQILQGSEPIVDPSLPPKSKVLFETVPAKSESIWSKVKPYAGWLFYPLIFAVSFSVFYFTLNFPSLTAQAGSWFNTKSQAQTQLGDNLTAYFKWINGYYYAITNKDLLQPNNDIDNDGLTNLDEFVMLTNPTLADSDSDSLSDGLEVLNLTNPWGSGAMTAKQKKLRETLNLSLISDRIGYSTSTKNIIEIKDNNFDLSRAGQLSIPKLNLQVPLIWSKDPSTFETDLENGVIHYPGTALPGEQGIVYVSGHSSDYLWKQNKYSTAFTKINRLVAGDDIFVTVYGSDGTAHTFRYRVTGNKIYSPDDQTQFIDSSSAKLNLSTCWPIGTSKDRLVVSAELVSL
jgi:LPXTG-site transpeptidase (sortase) family protein